MRAQNQSISPVLPNAAAGYPGEATRLAEVFRDPEGVPHIRASTAAEAFRTQGWVHAQDRFALMDADRRRAYGRWAEVAGPAGLPQDRLYRRLGIAARVEEEYRDLPPDAREMFDAYADGVNAFLGGSGEPWRPWDSMAVFKVRHVMMGVWQSKLWRGRVAAALGPAVLEKLMSPLQPGERLILPPGAQEALKSPAMGADVSYLRSAYPEGEHDGSNNWVLAGARTHSGKPLLAGDPHRAVEVPNVYYQNHVACDEFDAIGLSFAGVPGLPHFGHNARVAWCVTHTGADTQDLFVERVRGDQYEFRGEWKPLAISTETIHVKGAPDEVITIQRTHHGPLVNGMAFAYTASAGTYTGWRCLRPMLRAGSCVEMDEVMRDWVDPVNNFLTADVDGNIAYRTRGQVPVRNRLNGWVPVPGWTGEHEWQGLIPYDEMPHAMNPSEGCIVTANNRVVGDEYPHFIALTFASEDRARRVAERITAETGWTAAAMTDVHADVRSVAAREFLGLLPAIQARSPEGARALDVLRAWDGALRADAVGPTIYNALRDELALLVAEPLLGPLLNECLSENVGARAVLTRIRRHALRQASLGVTGGLLPSGRSWPELLSEALERGVARLARHQSWVWRDVHRLLDFGMAGDSDTVQAASFATGVSFAVLGSSVARYVFDLDDWERSGWAVPPTDAWRDHRLHPMRYDWGRVCSASGAAIIVR